MPKRKLVYDRKIIIKMPAEHKEWLRSESKKMGISMSELMRTIIESGLKYDKETNNAK